MNRSDNCWYKDAADWNAANGIAGGEGDNKFDPDSNGIRAQVSAILMRFIQNIAEKTKA